MVKVCGPHAVHKHSCPMGSNQKCLQIISRFLMIFQVSKNIFYSTPGSCRINITVLTAYMCISPLEYIVLAVAVYMSCNSM